MKLIIGSHVSFKKEDGLLGSVKEALSYKANTFMFYTGAPQNAKRLPINMELVDEAKKMMIDNGIDINNVIVHAPYIINLANGDDFAVSFLRQEVERCIKIGINKLVLHPGSYVSLSKEEGINNIVLGLNKILNKDMNIKILLETMAGKGTEIGCSFEDLKYIIDNVKYNEKLGVCLDTCHINDAGYDLNDFDSVIEEFDKIIGIDKLYCVHVNDSKNVFGLHKDRHENIGFGEVGFDTLMNVIYNKRLEEVPKILETPYVDREYPPYKYEIEMIKNRKFDLDLIKKIKGE